MEDFKEFSTQIQEQQIDVDNQPIKYVKTGNGTHTLLCFPGADRIFSTDFKPQIEGLDKNKFNIIALHPIRTRIYGSHSYINCSFDDYEKDADIAAKFMEALNIKKYSLLGADNGGISSIILASKYENNVEKLVIWGAKAYITNKEIESYKETLEVMNDMKKQGQPIKKKLYEQTCKMLQELEKRKGNVCNERLPLIKCPTLILHRDNDETIDAENSFYLFKNIKGAQYAGPLATICYLHVKTSRELQTQESSLAVVMFEARSRESRSRTDSHSTTTDFRGSRTETDGISQFSRGSFRDREGSRARYEICESELDVAKEKRTQKYLVSMVTMYAIFLCPLMVLRLARLALLETYDNSGHFDITYTTFVWFAFLPTCSTPLLFTSWQMSRPAKERLRGYFRFSNRKLRQSCEAVITAAGGTPVRRPRNSSHQGDPLVRRFEDGHSETNSFHQDLVS